MESISLPDRFRVQREYRKKHRISSFEDRIELLKKLRDSIRAHEDPLRIALAQDFRKAPSETDLTEILTSLTEINHTLAHLDDWMRTQPAPTPFTLMGTRSEIRFEPKGVVLIIAPWNYPFSLAINPLIAAWAAGNSVILKPSELTPHTSQLLREMLESEFRPEEVCVLEGGPEVSQQLLELPFDHIFFTGSTRVGKIVAQAAARNLTPVTLELGGKSPAFLDDSANLSLAARRIVWGKFLNGGQTCVAPDYVLVPEPKLAEFVGECERWLTRFYGDEKSREKSPDFCRIISPSHTERLKKLVDEAVQLGAELHAGGKAEISECYLAPTLLSRPPLDCALMKEEIFGPILPILPYKSWEEAEAIILDRAHPLALYVFSENPTQAEAALSKFASGGACINGTVIHLANPDLPFGGIGPSGMGNYHGHHGFRTFSHERAVLTQKRLSSLDWFQPPFTRAVIQRIRWIFKFFT